MIYPESENLNSSNVSKSKRILKRAGLIIGVLLILCLAFLVLNKVLLGRLNTSLNTNEDPNISTDWLNEFGSGKDKSKTPAPTKPAQSTNFPSTKNSFDKLPTLSGVQLSQKYEVDDAGGLRLTWDSKEGTSLTSKEVLDFYELELTSLGWQVMSRDGSDRQIELYNDTSGDFVRIWIYYEGEGLDGMNALTYIMDYQPQGTEILPVMHQ